MKLAAAPGVHWCRRHRSGAVFLYASLDKIAQPARVRAHRLPLPADRPEPGARLRAREPARGDVAVDRRLVAGALLVTGVWRREAAAVAAAMLVAFLVAVSWALASGIDIAELRLLHGRRRRGRPALGWKLLLGTRRSWRWRAWLAAMPPRALPDRRAQRQRARAAPPRTES